MPSGTLATTMQPDQRPERWDDHVLVYEHVFEPFSLALARPLLDRLAAPRVARRGPRVLDVGAGCGGLALALAARACDVTAIDASPQMIARITARAVMAGAEVAARLNAVIMDAQALTFGDAHFDATVSVFGVVLCPDAVRALSEMRRTTRPGGTVAVLTWTEPQHYELAAALRAAIQQVRPAQTAAALPAQLRYRERSDFAALFAAAGLGEPVIETVRAAMEVPSARWLAERIAFAPGMAAQLAGLGDDRRSVLETFVQNLERAQGRGAISLGGVAFLGTAQVC